MNAINFVIAAFLFGIGWLTMVGVTATVVATCTFVALEQFGAKAVMPEGIFLALIIPVTFGTYVGLSAMDYAKHLIKNLVRDL